MNSTAVSHAMQMTSSHPFTRVIRSNLSRPPQYITLGSVLRPIIPGPGMGGGGRPLLPFSVSSLAGSDPIGPVISPLCS